MLKLDEQTGALTLDGSFRDGDGAAGFNPPRVASRVGRDGESPRRGVLAIVPH
jgi:hypothetical protein